MKKVVSVSGGKSSAYIAANYYFDYAVFALVTTDDTRCLYPDEKLRQQVSDRIGREFIGTLEDDIIIHTIFDLEQYIGKEITWVVGDTFDYVVGHKGGYLPNKLHRYCTTNLKLNPIFNWWYKKINEPVEMMIGFRANEKNRVFKMMSRCNPDGLLEFNATVRKWEDGRHKGKNKWEDIAWQKPSFPMFFDGIHKDDVDRYWDDKPVRFAKYNNCTGCFHRNPAFLKVMMEEHPNKLQWFIDTENREPGTWRSDVRYQQIKDYNFTMELAFDSFCDVSCGL